MKLEDDWILETQPEEDGAAWDKHTGGVNQMNLQFADRDLHPNKAGNYCMGNEDLAGPVEVSQ